MLAEIDRIIALLEAEIPANPSSPKNQRLAQRLERELARYFRGLEDVFPYDETAALYNRYVRESVGSETGNVLDPILKSLQTDLLFRVNGHMVTIYTTASAEMISWGKTKAGVPIAFEGPPIERAITWAERHGATLVTRMDAETKSQLAKIVSDGVKNKRGIPGLQRDIRTSFTDMSRDRARAIARTETSDALGQAFMDRGRDMGIDGKESVLGGNPCPICVENASVGAIPLGEAFPSGHMQISFHPNCVCAMAPVRLKR